MPGSATYLTRPVFDWPVNWAEAVSPGIDYDTRPTELGMLGPRQEPNASHPSHRLKVGVLLEDRSSIQAMDTFFAALHGRLNGFWMIDPLEAFEIADGVSTSQFVVRWQGLSQAYADRACLHLAFTKSGETTLFGQISTVAEVTGGEQVTLTGAVGSVDETWECHRLLYVRLDGDEESEFLADNLQRRTLLMVELTTEYASIETGTQKVYLYQFRIDAPTNPGLWSYTSLSENVDSTAPGSATTFESYPIEHGALTRSMRPDQEELEIRAWYDPSSPLARYVPVAVARPLYVTVWETHYETPNDATKIFEGLVSKLSTDGMLITALCHGMLDYLRRTLPAVQVQPRCNWFVFGSACGVSKTQWDSLVEIVGIWGNTIKVRSVVGNSPDVFTGALVDFFTFGYIETGDEQTYEVRTVLESGAETDGDMVLVLNASLHHARVGQLADLYPGCDGSKAMCDGRYNNVARYGGFDYVPASNPTVQAVQVDHDAGGKK